MKLVRFACLLMVVCSFVACGDDAGDCVQGDWVGTYSGTIDCDGVEEAVTVTVTASGDTDINFEYTQASGLTTTLDPFTPDGCGFDISESAGGITLTSDGELDGNTLTYSEEFGTDAGSSNCSFTATRN